MPPPTQQDLIDAYERMLRAIAAADTARDAYIAANGRAEAAKQTFHTLACAFCEDQQP